MATVSSADRPGRMLVDRRLTWRVPWPLWALVAAALLALVHFKHPSLLTGTKLPLVLLGILFVILVAAILWELPPAVMMCGAVALTMFSGNWGNLGLSGLPIDRALLAGSVLAVLLRSPGAAHIPRPRVRAVHVLMLVVVLYATASAVLDSQIGTQFADFGVLDRLGAIPFLMFLVTPIVFSTQRERDWLLGTLVVLGAYLGLTAVFETLGPHALVLPRYIYDLDAARGTVQAVGPFSAVVTEGWACFACAVASMMAFLRWRSGWRWVALMVVMLSLLGSTLSLERGVWIGIGVGSLAFALAFRELRRWLVPGAVAAAAVIVGLLLAVPSLHSSAGTRFNDKLPVYDRQNQTVAALNMIQAKPLFGFGWANWGNTSGPYFRLASNRPLTGYPGAEVQSTPSGSETSVTSFYSGSPSSAVVHDTYLSNAVELGLVGAGLWLIAVLWGLGGAILSPGIPDLRLWKIGLLAIGICYLVVCAVDPLSQNFVQLLLWVWAGVAVSDNIGRQPATSLSPAQADAGRAAAAQVS